MLLIEDRLKAAQEHHDAGRRESAALIYESVLDFSPSSIDAFKALLKIRMELGDLEAAQSLAQKALTLAGNNADILSLCAQLFVLAQQEDKAQAFVDQALSSDPMHADAAILKAQFFIKDGQVSEAEVLLSDVRAAHPEDIGIVRAMSQLYAAHGIYPPALELAQDALQRDPENADLNGLIGEILSGLGDNEKASHYLQKAHLKAPENPGFMIAIASNLAALGYLSEAQRVTKRATTLFPDLLPAWLCHVRVMIERGEPRAALAEFLPVVKRNPDRIDASLALALAYRMAGLSEQALRLLEPLIANHAKLPADKSQRLWNLARDCYLSTGEIDKAVGTFDQVPLGETLGLPADLIANDQSLAEALSTANYVVDTGITNLELIVLLRFVLQMSKGSGATLSGSQTLSQLAELFDAIAYTGIDLAREAPPQTEDVVSFPISLLLAIPEAIRGDVTTSLPYISPPEARTEHWRLALSEFPRPWIALAWDASRPGLLLEDYGPALREFPGTVFSVAWDDTRHQLKAFPDIVDTGVHFKDLVDLSCVLSEMDLVIGPDGIPLHVAGALGKAAIVLTRPARPWYWHADAGKALWYPSALVVSSPQFGNWAELFPQIAQEVLEQVSQLLDLQAQSSPLTKKHHASE
ncbi:tetratricopeptide repeat protein [Roseibium polysiphoniae]|uniref:Tetratricopeptide repeat protein n=1 Tax=Roseibium polysiphoniae TaxID=2571221 RepID=A0ABR9CCA3_9HYPH|nr:tetratricopeptide repeat protein [Roseibium polysiphoniae]MBD8876710.1 tetratricopeptide repeat protein [Roseibium polysiphoniae]